jgi:hypothetical protein
VSRDTLLPYVVDGKHAVFAFAARPELSEGEPFLPWWLGLLGSYVPFCHGGELPLQRDARIERGVPSCGNCRRTGLWKRIAAAQPEAAA